MNPATEDVGLHADLRIRTIRSIDELDRVRTQWEALWEQCTGRTPFLCFDWVRAWAQTCGAGHELHCLLLECGAEPVAIMPLVVECHSLGPLRIRALQTAGGDSRNTIALVKPGSEQAAARACSDYLCENALLEFTCLNLKLVPVGAPFLVELCRFIAARNEVDCRLSPSSTAPYVRLSEVRDQSWPGLSAKRRKLLRRSLRRLETGHEVAYEDCHDEAVAAAMDDLYRVHQARWNAIGMRGLFADSAAREFHSLVARRLDGRGMLDLNRMTIDGEVASVHFALVLDGVLYLLRSGRSLNYEEYEIGHLHDLVLFRSAANAGLQEVDFLRGAEPYKYYWTREQRAYVDVVMTLKQGRIDLSASSVAVLLRIAAFLGHRHSPRELRAILRVRRRQGREMRSMRLQRSIDKSPENPQEDLPWENS